MKLKALYCCLFIALLFSCKKNDTIVMEEMEAMEETEVITPTTNDSIPSNMNCTFVQIDSNNDGFIDDIERMIMDSCRLNPFTSESVAVNSLIGEWELVGHGEGWIHTTSLPCSYITITSEELIFEFTSEFQDTISLHSWETFQSTSNEAFRMAISPPLSSGVSLYYFSTNYMYGDLTPGDGNMYLYEKVE